MTSNSDKGEIKTRSDIESRFKWDLSKMYSSDDEWKADLERLRSEINEIGKFEGTLSESNRRIAKLFRLYDGLERSMEKVFTYAHLKHDEDLTDSKYKSMFDMAMIAHVKLSEISSFIAPEIASMEDNKLEGLLEDPELEFARVPLRDLIRMKEHFLSREEERLLSMAGEVFAVPSRVFSMLNDADLRFPSIEDSSGNPIEVTHGRYVGLLMSPDREIRRRAFKSLYSSYDSHINTFCASLEGEMKHRVFNARARKYDGALQASLDWDEVSVDVYENLIRSVRDNLPDMYRYQGIRKKALSIDELHMWDVYVPLVKDFERKFTFEEAKEIVIAALEPLGEEVVGIAEEAFRDRWIDRYESRGKRSGAYSSGCYDSPPYILMNFDGSIRDLFTIIHELGHSIHTYLSNKSQPHITADYKIFVAEVASTVNEILLLEYLKDRWRSNEERLFLINHHIDGFKGTVFRQTMFAEFERDITSTVERDEPLTPEMLSSAYFDLNSNYHGPHIESDSEIGLEWARIPHFYYNFYVYKYATGYSAANAIASSITGGKTSFVDNYLDMLRAGGSKPPLEVLGMANVDLRVTEPIDRGLEKFSSLVSEMERMI